MINNPWIVHVKGSFDHAGEIAVVREGDSFSQQSYGWFGSRKLLIFGSGGPCQYTTTETIWNKLLKVAEETAAELNAKE